MLKVIRRGAIDNPWFFRSVMLIMAIVFAISMGWWGFGGGADNVIAKVDQAKISQEEYQRAYVNASNLYREIFQDKYDDNELRKRVIDELVERKLWLKEARNLRLAVSDEELRNAITAIPSFQKDGQFDPTIYKRTLAMGQISPEYFERQQREELLIEKAKVLVKDAVALTPAEIAEANKSNPANPDPDRAASDLLFQKRQRALRSYTLALKQSASIDIKEELL